MSKIALLKAIWAQSRGLLFFICALIVLSLGLWIYQAQFIAPETERLHHQQVLLQNQVRDREAKLAESGVPVSTVEKRAENLLKFSAMIPEKQYFADFVGDLFSWAEQADLTIDQISYQPKVDPEASYLLYALSFSVQGTYDQLKKFIHLLENSSRILIIDQLSLTGKRETSNSAVVSLQINLKTFFHEGTP